MQVYNYITILLFFLAEHAKEESEEIEKEVYKVNFMLTSHDLSNYLLSRHCRTFYSIVINIKHFLRKSFVLCSSELRMYVCVFLTLIKFLVPSEF